MPCDFLLTSVDSGASGQLGVSEGCELRRSSNWRPCNLIGHTPQAHSNSRCESELSADCLSAEITSYLSASKGE